MKPEIERLVPYLERARGATGWDFSDLKVRTLGPPLPWDYEQLVRENARGAQRALDMGTGGGEVLARVRSSLPATTVATEHWHVNAPIARDRLRPLGVDVVRCRSMELPFDNEMFDLVINRHEELDPVEVARVLRPRGRVVTQQVGRNNAREVRQYISRKTDWGDLFSEYSNAFEAAGLDVTMRCTQDYKSAFATLGDLVYLLGVAPWEIPDFSLERDGEALLQLEADFTTEDGLVLTESRFIIVAEKPQAFGRARE
jgi:SAM-dependent methyltransferase